MKATDQSCLGSEEWGFLGSGTITDVLQMVGTEVYLYESWNIERRIDDSGTDITHPTWDVVRPWCFAICHPLIDG